MRTTLNLDDDVTAQVRELARREGRSLSRTVNDLVRTGLRAQQADRQPAPYDPPTFDSGMPLVDVTDVASTLGLLDMSHEPR